MKYTLKNKYEDIFIKAKGKQNNFEIYSLLNLNANNLNLNELPTYNNQYENNDIKDMIMNNTEIKLLATLEDDLEDI